MNVTHQKIAVLGAGRSGLAAARLARQRGADVVLLDSGKARETDFQAVFGPDALEFKAAIDLVIVSPGIDLRNAMVKQFTDRGLPVIGEIEFASRFWQQDIVGITGTNGKTTTTELTSHLLEGAVAGGNYGKPFAEIVLDDPLAKVAVLELSSFQLESVDIFRPGVSVWMNFAPDHMDRYDAVEDYRQAKLRLFQNQTSEDWAILNAVNGPDIELAPKTVTFTAFQSGADFTYDGGAILFRGEEVAQLAETNLSGKHNAENLMAAMAVGFVRGVPFSRMREAAASYQPPRHRCERVGATGSGVLVLNDSKATNVHALESSLRALDGPLVLIAGGKDKGLDYSGLKTSLSNKVIQLIAIGEIRDQLVAESKPVCAADRADSLEEAVDLAFRQAPVGATILFSPGTSSFDMFTGYEHRGDVFCSLAKRHLANP